MSTSTCRGCGKPIVWATTPDGKQIPLDPRPPCYEVVQDIDTGEATCTRKKDAMVTHFATCPKADQFSSGRRP